MLPQTQLQHFHRLLPGADIKVTFTVEVVAGEGDLTLTTGLAKSSGQSQYWSLVTDDYPMGDNYNPAQAINRVQLERRYLRNDSLRKGSIQCKYHKIH